MFYSYIYIYISRGYHEVLSPSSAPDHYTGMWNLSPDAPEVHRTTAIATQGALAQMRPPTASNQGAQGGSLRGRMGEGLLHPATSAQIRKESRELSTITGTSRVAEAVFLAPTLQTLFNTITLRSMSAQ